MAEVISKKKAGSKWEFYVHYLSCEPLSPPPSSLHSLSPPSLSQQEAG